MEDYVDFEDKFKQLIEKHKNDLNYNLIKDYPSIFSVVLNIASDRNSDGMVKMFMNSAISYFVIPEDVISEKEFGIKGYLDDFFICICALRELLNYDKNLGRMLISKYWTLEKEFEDYIPNTYYQLTQKIGQKITEEIIHSSGMRFSEEIMYTKTNPKKYLELKTHDLQKKIRYLLYLFLKRPIIGKNERKKFEEMIFGTEEFREFTKKIELLSKSGEPEVLQCKENIDKMLDIDVKLKKIKAKRLLK